MAFCIVVCVSSAHAFMHGPVNETLRDDVCIQMVSQRSLYKCCFINMEGHYFSCPSGEAVPMWGQERPIFLLFLTFHL